MFDAPGVCGDCERDVAERGASEKLGDLKPRAKGRCGVPGDGLRAMPGVVGEVCITKVMQMIIK